MPSRFLISSPDGVHIKISKICNSGFELVEGPVFDLAFRPQLPSRTFDNVVETYLVEAKLKRKVTRLGFPFLLTEPDDEVHQLLVVDLGSASGGTPAKTTDPDPDENSWHLLIHNERLLNENEDAFNLVLEERGLEWKHGVSGLASHIQL